MEKLYEILLNKRLELRLSLRDAAKLIGISHTYLSALEKGKDPRTNAPINPTPDTLKMISKAYNLPYEHLMQLLGYIVITQEPQETTFIKKDEDGTSIDISHLLNKAKVLNVKDKKDIAKQVERMINNIEDVDGLEFYNQPQDDEDMEFIKRGLERFLEDVKIYNKVKYTPKKYRRNDE